MTLRKDNHISLSPFHFPLQVLGPLTSTKEVVENYETDDLWKDHFAIKSDGVSENGKSGQTCQFSTFQFDKSRGEYNSQDKPSFT